MDKDKLERAKELIKAYEPNKLTLFGIARTIEEVREKLSEEQKEQIKKLLEEKESK